MREQQINSRFSLKQSRRIRRGWITSSAVLAVLLVFVLLPWSSEGARVLGFQSNLPEREPSRPDYWILSNLGGQVDFGGIQAVLPVGFTEQSGASVFGNTIQSSTLAKPLKLLPGTEFAFGIWPTQVQRDFPKPIEFRVWLNAADFPNGGEDNLLFMKYDPDQSKWRTIPSNFDPGTYQIVAQVQSFTPVADDFPDWGGRTFFGVFHPGAESGEAPPSAADALPAVGSPRVNTNANLRAGPGVSYAVIGYAPRGSEVDPVATNRYGTWLLLSDEKWISARLVDGVPPLPTSTAIQPMPVESTRTPTPQATSTRTATATPASAPGAKTTATLKFVTVADGDLLDLDAVLPESSGNADLAIIFFGEAPSLILVNDAKISAPISTFGRRDRCVQAGPDDEALDVTPEALPVYACVSTSDGNLASISIRSIHGTEETLRILFSVWPNDVE